MAEYLDRLIKATEDTGWVAETASSVLSLKRRFESGEITEEKYIDGLDALKSGEGEVGYGGSYQHRPIMDNAIVMLKKMI